MAQFFGRPAEPQRKPGVGQTLLRGASVLGGLKAKREAGKSAQAGRQATIDVAAAKLGLGRIEEAPKGKGGLFQPPSAEGAQPSLKGRIQNYLTQAGIPATDIADISVEAGPEIPGKAPAFTVRLGTNLYGPVPGLRKEKPQERALNALSKGGTIPGLGYAGTLKLARGLPSLFDIPSAEMLQDIIREEELKRNPGQDVDRPSPMQGNRIREWIMNLLSRERPVVGEEEELPAEFERE